MNSAIEVSNLWKIYSEGSVNADLGNEEEIEALGDEDETVLAVRDVSFTVEPGEVFIVMGLSGSGKSTLVRCLIRLVEPTEGTIVVSGHNIVELDQNDLTEFRRTETAMVFQHYGLLPHRTVIENVSFGLKLRGISKKERHERAREMLERVGLDGWEDYHPAALSGGMRQRVGIARALVADPPILLMDEPFSGLDPLIRRDMQDQLIQLQEKMQKTIFFVTHDLDEAMKLGDRMAVMRAGRFVQVGSPDEILADPADEYVARFVQDKKRQLERAEGRRSERPKKDVPDQASIPEEAVAEDVS